MRRLLALLVLPSVLAGCPAPEDDPCTLENQKVDVLDLMQGYYLYPELLRSVDPRDPAYPTVADYLAALTADARAAGKDRGWTYATTYAQLQQRYGDATSVGFGFGLLVRQDPSLAYHVLVSQVYPGSAAAAAGFARGDELLAIGDTGDALVDVSTIVAGAADPGAAGALVASALGPSTAGVSRTLRVLTLGGATDVRTMSKGTFGLDPVPEGWAVIPRAGMVPAGYVALRTFVSAADPLLQEVFAQFRLAGVQDVVVDLRYNGGGVVSTAELLTNLLAADRAPTDVMFSVEYNAALASRNGVDTFSPLAESIAPARIAFVTTGASASASELVPNALEAWKHADVALVGARTLGKPVGQLGFTNERCDVAVVLVAYRLRNAEGDGDYFEGLPDPGTPPSFSGPLCAADDDLTRAPSDPAEASTAAALSWLATGACPTPGAAKPSSAPIAARAGPSPDAYPQAIAPDEAQRNVRGLF